MNFKEFQQLALRTESKIDTAQIDIEGVKKLLKMFIGVGDLLDYTKKGVFYKNYEKYDDNLVELVDELNGNLGQFIYDGTDRKEVSDINFRIFHGLLGIITESAEVAQVLLHQLETGAVDKVNLAEECIGDIGWYQAILTDELGLDFDQSLINVINKLKIRYPEKFDATLAIERKLDLERKELSNNL